MCLFSNPSEICNHPECLRYSFATSGAHGSNTNLIGNLNLLIQQQSMALAELINKNSLLNNKLDLLQSSLKGGQKLVHQDLNQNNEDIFRFATDNRTFNLFTQLKSEFPQVIYKERGFPLEVEVVDETGRRLEKLGNLNFNISLFTMENPPKVLKNNISGKKILRGSIEATCEEGLAVFNNIVINEVTSHYPNNKFCFVIMCSSCQDIKPLILSGITVRARKHKQ